MMRKKPCAERLLKPPCLGFGFEDLDFVTDALVSPTARPFGLERHWLANIWEAAESQAQFAGGEAFTADLVVFLRGVDCIAAAAAGEIGVPQKQSDCWPPTITNECWAGISEAGFNPFETEYLCSAAVVKFHKMGRETNAG